MAANVNMVINANVQVGLSLFKLTDELESCRKVLMAAGADRIVMDAWNKSVGGLVERCISIQMNEPVKVNLN